MGDFVSVVVVWLYLSDRDNVVAVQRWQGM